MFLLVSTNYKKNLQIFLAFGAQVSMLGYHCVLFLFLEKESQPSVSINPRKTTVKENTRNIIVPGSEIDEGLKIIIDVNFLTKHIMQKVFSLSFDFVFFLQGTFMVQNASFSSFTHQGMFNYSQVHILI